MTGTTRVRKQERNPQNSDAGPRLLGLNDSTHWPVICRPTNVAAFIL